MKPPAPPHLLPKLGPYEVLCQAEQCLLAPDTSQTRPPWGCLVWVGDTEPLRSPFVLAPPQAARAATIRHRCWVARVAWAPLVPRQGRSLTSSAEHPCPGRCSCRPSFTYLFTCRTPNRFVQRHLRQIDPSHLVRVRLVKEGNKFSSAKTEVLSEGKNFTRSWFFSFQSQGQVLFLPA